MGKQLNIMTFSNSLSAIRKFLSLNGDCGKGDYNAKVLVSSNGKIQFSDTLRVIISIDHNDAHVYIIGNTQFERDYYSDYSALYQVFDQVGYTLLIKGVDRFNRSIEIDITT